MVNIRNIITTIVSFIYIAWGTVTILGAPMLVGESMPRRKYLKMENSNTSTIDTAKVLKSPYKFTRRHLTHLHYL